MQEDNYAGIPPTGLSAHEFGVDGRSCNITLWLALGKRKEDHRATFGTCTFLITVNGYNSVVDADSETRNNK